MSRLRRFEMLEATEKEPAGRPFDFAQDKSALPNGGFGGNLALGQRRG
jgi:hypothetical protein